MLNFINSLLLAILLISPGSHSKSVAENESFGERVRAEIASLFGSATKTHANDAEEIPIFIAHRGDKILIPEHTLAAYDVAMMSNIDYVEPDLVLTRDRVLVCHHDLTLKGTTDVEQRKEFAARMVEKVTLELDGKNVTIENDWFISDFTFEELSTLRLYQKKSDVRPQYFNGLYRIPSFHEYIDIVHRGTWRRRFANTGEKNDLVTGMIPELKHPRYHNELVFHTDHLMENTFLEELEKLGYNPPKIRKSACNYNGVNIPCSPIVVQCFDVPTVRYLRTNTDLSLLTLVDTQNLIYLTYKGMESLANVTDFVGLWKELLYTGTEQELIYEKIAWNETEIGEMGGFIEADKIVDFAHGLGIKVGIYTMYQSLEKSRRGCASGVCDTDVTKDLEFTYYLDLGVDAFFVEGVTDSLRIRERYYASRGGVSDGSQGILNGGTGSAPNIKPGSANWVLSVGVFMLVVLRLTN